MDWEKASEDRRIAEAAEQSSGLSPAGAEGGGTERVGDLSGAGQLVSQRQSFNSFSFMG